MGSFYGGRAGRGGGVAGTFSYHLASVDLISVLPESDSRFILLLCSRISSIFKLSDIGLMRSSIEAALVKSSCKTVRGLLLVSVLLICRTVQMKMLDCWYMWRCWRFDSINNRIISGLFKQCFLSNWNHLVEYLHALNYVKSLVAILRGVCSGGGAWCRLCQLENWGVELLGEARKC